MGHRGAGASGYCSTKTRVAGCRMTLSTESESPEAPGVSGTAVRGLIRTVEGMLDRGASWATVEEPTSVAQDGLDRFRETPAGRQGPWRLLRFPGRMRTGRAGQQSPVCILRALTRTGPWFAEVVGQGWLADAYCSTVKVGLTSDINSGARWLRIVDPNRLR